MKMFLTMVLVIICMVLTKSSFGQVDSSQLNKAQGKIDKGQKKLDNIDRKIEKRDKQLDKANRKLEKEQRKKARQEKRLEKQQKKLEKAKEATPGAVILSSEPDLAGLLYEKSLPEKRSGTGELI